jgi:hypothetical protein
MSDQISQRDDMLLPAALVRRRYNCSDMFLWRQLHREGSQFPTPLRINGRRFWRLSALVEYERSLSTGPNPKEAA